MGRRFLAYPYHLWTILFTVIPLALIVYRSVKAKYTMSASGMTVKRIVQR